MHYLIDRIKIKENREMVWDFLHKELAKGLSPIGLKKKIFSMRKFSELLKKPFSEATVNDFRCVMERIELSKYSESTKDILKITLKEFFGKEDLRVSWIRIHSKVRSHVNPYDLVTREDLREITGSFEDFYKYGNYLRAREKRALFLFLYDSAVRPREFITMTRNSVIDDKDGIYILVPKVKTPERVIFLVDSKKIIKDVPFGKLTYGGLASIFKRTGERCKMHIYPYLLRHSRITELSKNPNWTRSLLCEFAGWTQSSRMPDVYVHIDKIAMKNAMLSNVIPPGTAAPRGRGLTTLL